MTTARTPPDDPAQPLPGPGPDSGIHRFGALFGAVIAPTSFVTALLYYFGLNQASWFYAYFGVNSTTLGLGTTDYLVISVDAMFNPMVATAAGGLLAFWGHDLLRTRLAAGGRPRVLRLLLPALAAVGLLLAVGGLLSVFDRDFFLRRQFVAAPLSLAAGVILLAYALHLRRTLGPPPPPRPPETEPEPTLVPPDGGGGEGEGARGEGNAAPPPAPAPPRPSTAVPATPLPSPLLRPEWAAVAEWAVIFVLVGLSLVWAATDYAAAVGRDRADRFVSKLPTSTTTVLRSTRSLGLDVPGVREMRCADTKSAYPYRYEGLVLVIQSANQYVFLPRSWRPDNGVAVMLPRTDSVRLEFVPHRAGGALGRPTC
ncbi:hypothetical protein [Streptomyces sp. NPDC048442]|uniref:hypothetical protein n=1 Tax=Streptomyces sp. NPDC048442 TaxID=3154823 RepID=UPI0034472A5A